MVRAILACLLCALASVSVHAGLPETLVGVKPSVVAIATFSPLRSPARIVRATGFAVGDGQSIVTNAHVVTRALEENEKLVVLQPLPGQQVRQFEARVIVRRPEYDLALLRIEGGSLPPLKVAPQESIREGQEIVFTGFPIGEVLGLTPVTHRGIISAITPIAIPGGNAAQVNESAVRRLRSGPFMVYQLDATAYPSNSGSPVYSAESGEVIGIINSGYVKSSKESALSAPSGITFAIPARHLSELLNTPR